MVLQHSRHRTSVAAKVAPQGKEEWFGIGTCAYVFGCERVRVRNSRGHALASGVTPCGEERRCPILESDSREQKNWCKFKNVMTASL